MPVGCIGPLFAPRCLVAERRSESSSSAWICQWICGGTLSPGSAHSVYVCVYRNPNLFIRQWTSGVVSDARCALAKRESERAKERLVRRAHNGQMHTCTFSPYLRSTFSLPACSVRVCWWCESLSLSRICECFYFHSPALLISCSPLSQTNLKISRSKINQCVCVILICKKRRLDFPK